MDTPRIIEFSKEWKIVPLKFKVYGSKIDFTFCSTCKHLVIEAFNGCAGSSFEVCECCGVNACPKCCSEVFSLYHKNNDCNELCDYCYETCKKNKVLWKEFGGE